MLSVAARIIEAVDVFKYCHLYRPPCLPSMTPDKFSLDGFEKPEAALDDRQTPNNAKTAELAALATRSAKKMVVIGVNYASNGVQRPGNWEYQSGIWRAR